MDAISPIDGRYRKYTEPLAAFFGEAAFMRYRIVVEAEYVIVLSETRGVGLRAFTPAEKKTIRTLSNLSPEDVQMIRDLELKGYGGIPATNHDFKAIEYFMKLKLERTSLENVVEWIHFGLTSWDPTNIAYALMTSDALSNTILPALLHVHKALRKLARAHAAVPMLARTHGQPASPTTFGKEMNVFASRLARQMKQIRAFHIRAKLNGATGNYNALAAAYPNIDWIAFSKKFIKSLQLEANLITTQIEPYDSCAELFDILRRANTILVGLNQDIWRYVSDGWISQKFVKGEVGSSTMPHKINPWFFENSEGNLCLANALFEFFSRKLPISRLQRDLSDSTVLRSFGTAFGHSLIGYAYLLKALDRVAVNEKSMWEALERHPEVVTEAIQTILRREGIPMPYEKLKKLARGKEVSLQDIRKFIDALDVPKKLKSELKRITPMNYTGLAERLAKF